MPIHNIFQKTRKKLRKSILKTPKIIADIHEKNSLVIAELHNSTQIRLDIQSLKIADYVIGNIAIERKTVSDFINSMINKRLIQQLKQMQKYKQQLLIIEGDLTSALEERTNLTSAVRGFIISLLTNYQIPIIQTRDYEETAKYLITLAKQQVKPKTEPTLHHRIPKSIKEQKQYILESFPSIGPVTAKKLLKEFKTVKNTINASEEELNKILKSKVKSFKNLLDA